MIIKEFVDSDLFERTTIEAKAEVEKRSILRRYLQRCIEQSEDGSQDFQISIENISDILKILNRLEELESRRVSQLSEETYVFERQHSEGVQSSLGERKLYRHMVAELMMLMSLNEIAQDSVGLERSN